MTQVLASNDVKRAGPRRPVATWILMLAALTVTLLLPDWNGHGPLLPVWFMVFPVVLGLVGAWCASRENRLGWALASGIWGAMLVPGLWIMTTLGYGP